MKKGNRVRIVNPEFTAEILTSLRDNGIIGEIVAVHDWDEWTENTIEVRFDGDEYRSFSLAPADLEIVKG